MEELMEGHNMPCLLVCHGGTITQIVSWWLRIPLETLSDVNFRAYNTGITVLSETGSGIRQIERHNDTRHLIGLGAVDPLVGRE